MIRRAFFPAVLALLASLGGWAGLADTRGGAGGSPPPAEPSFAEVERLIADQQFQRAADVLVELRRRAGAAGDEDAATRALVEEVRVRLALGRFEATVELLRAEPWPEAPGRRAAVGLLYAYTLEAYHDRYSWEIARRERVGEDLPADLAQWTREQVFAEAMRGALVAWERRAALGATGIAALGPVVEAGNYPAAVRGTARDAITYLLVELLADTGFWSPGEENGVYRLDLERLLGSRGAAPLESAAVASSAEHPLARLAAALVDLEAWHAGARRPGAQFEARLELLRRLQASFTASADRRTLRQDLERRLDGFRADSWWAMGQATLAELVRARDTDDGPASLARAREIALAGRSAYPESPGGQKCAAIVAEIEEPELRLTVMASDGAARRSLEVEARNLARLHLRAYRFDLERRLLVERERTPWPEPDEVERLLRRPPAAEWSVDLPATPDYREHRTYVTPPLATPGAYVIVASSRPDFARASTPRP